MKIGTLLLVTSLVLIGCSSPKKVTTCQESDWYELGRREGANGVPLTLSDDVQPLCKNSDRRYYRALFRNGHYAGLLEYCSTSNAFELGRIGRSVLKVCPHHLSGQFQSYYDRGKRYTELEMQNRGLEQRLITLDTQLLDEVDDPAERGKIRNQMDSLKGQQKQNLKEMSLLRIDSSIN